MYLCVFLQVDAPMDLKTETRVVGGRAFVQVYVRNTTPSTELVVSSIALAPADGLATTDLGRVDGDYDGDQGDSDGAAAFPSYNGDVSSNAPVVDGGRGPFAAAATTTASTTASTTTTTIATATAVGPAPAGAALDDPVAHAVAALDRTVALAPGDERQFLYMVACDAPPPPTDGAGAGAGAGGATIEADGRAVGVVHVQWRTAMCETGAFKSVPVCAPLARRRDVEVALLKAGAGSRRRLATAGGIPATLFVGQCCGVAVSVTNNTEKPRALQLAWRLPAAAAAANMVSLSSSSSTTTSSSSSSFAAASSSSSSSALSVHSVASPAQPFTPPSIVVQGVATQSLGVVGRGASVETSVTALALAPGMHPIAGLVVVDEENGEEFPQPPLATVLVASAQGLTPEQVRAASEASAAAAREQQQQQQQQQQQPLSPQGQQQQQQGGGGLESPGGNNRPRSGSYTTGNRSRSNSAVVMSSPFPAPLRSSSRSSSTALNDGGSDDNDVEDDEDDGVGEGALATSPALSPAAAAAAAAPTANSVGMDDDDLPPAPVDAPFLKKQTTGGGVHGDGSNDCGADEGAPADTWDSEDLSSPRPVPPPPPPKGSGAEARAEERQGDNVGEDKKEGENISPAGYTDATMGEEAAAQLSDDGGGDDDDDLPPAPADAPFLKKQTTGGGVHGDGSNDRGADEREAIRFGGDDAAADDDAAEAAATAAAEAFQGGLEDEGTVEDPLMESVMFGENSVASASTFLSSPLDAPTPPPFSSAGSSSDDRGSSSDRGGSSDRLEGIQGEKLLASPTNDDDDDDDGGAGALPRQPLAPASGDVSSLFGDSADSVAAAALPSSDAVAAAAPAPNSPDGDVSDLFSSPTAVGGGEGASGDVSSLFPTDEAATTTKADDPLSGEL